MTKTNSKPQVGWNPAAMNASPELWDAYRAAESEAKESYARFARRKEELVKGGVNPLSDDAEAKAAVEDLERLNAAYQKDLQRVEALTSTLNAWDGGDNLATRRSLSYGVGVDGEALIDPGRAFRQFVEFNAAFDTTGGGVASPPLVTGYFSIIQSRPLSVLELIPHKDVPGLGGGTLSYILQSAEAMAAEAVAHLGTKPTSVLSISREETTLHTIAHVTEQIPLQLLTDYEELEQFINNKMARGVAETAESYAISGTGASQPTGILATGGIGSQARGGDSPEAAIRKAVTVLQLLNIQPDAVVLNPTDFQNLELETDAEGAYLTGGPMAEDPGRVWRVRLVPSTAISAGTGLVGNFQLGARWWQGYSRMNWSENVASDFVANSLRARAESGFAFACAMPSAFCEVTGL